MKAGYERIVDVEVDISPLSGFIIRTKKVVWLTVIGFLFLSTTIILLYNPQILCTLLLLQETFPNRKYIEPDENEPLDNYITKKLNELDATILGSVIYPQDTSFENASHVWNLQVKSPRAVIEPASTDDVVLALSTLTDLQEKGIEFRIKSGGHNYAGYSSVESGIILSTKRLNHIKFNETTGIATVGPSVTNKEILEQIVIPKGYGGVLGMCPSVAVGGFVMGGGMGMLSRSNGLGLDNVLSAVVVLANGTVVQLNSDGCENNKEEQELFWAIRGAGNGNFGVLTEITYQMVPALDSMLVVLGKIPLNEMPIFTTKFTEMENDIFGGFYPDFFGPASPIDTGSDSDVDEVMGFSVVMTWVGPDEETVQNGETYIKNMLDQLLPVPTKSTFEYSYTSWYELTKEFGDLEGNLVRAWNGFIMPANNTIKVWEEIVSVHARLTRISPYLSIDFGPVGKAVNAKSSNDTAFFWRESVWYCGLILLVPADLHNAQEIFEEIISIIDKEIKQVLDFYNGVYNNVQMESLSKLDYAKSYWGGNLERLIELKMKLDPNNVFRHPQSIPHIG